MIRRACWKIPAGSAAASQSSSLSSKVPSSLLSPQWPGEAPGFPQEVEQEPRAGVVVVEGLQRGPAPRLG